MVFQVSFKWYDSNTYCTNMVIANSMDDAKSYYESKYSNVHIRSAKDWEIESARRKGMPFVNLKEVMACNTAQA